MGARIWAAAHRVVHGGNRRVDAMRVDDALIAELRALVPIAPLHQQACLALIDHLAIEHPGIPQFVCFDTTFHQSLDRLETTFGLPRAMTEQGLRRYGFHGLSYEYIARALPGYDRRAAPGQRSQPLCLAQWHQSSHNHGPDTLGRPAHGYPSRSDRSGGVAIPDA